MMQDGKSKRAESRETKHRVNGTSVVLIRDGQGQEPLWLITIQGAIAGEGLSTVCSRCYPSLPAPRLDLVTAVRAPVIRNGNPQTDTRIRHDTISSLICTECICANGSCLCAGEQPALAYGLTSYLCNVPGPTQLTACSPPSPLTQESLASFGCCQCWR